MMPVPFIILYLRSIATFLSKGSASAARIVDLLFERARRKVAPVEEFQWLGLMLFVAVPFPGTGAWSGAIVASVLGLPFWSGLSGKFCGSRPSRTLGKFTHEPWSEICNSHWDISFFCIFCHVGCSSVHQEVTECMM
jgi:hypothetical protein